MSYALRHGVSAHVMAECFATGRETTLIQTAFTP